MSNVNSASSLIDALGGNAKVVEMTQLTSQAISMWRKNGIPRSWEIVLQAELEKLQHREGNPDEQTGPTEA